MPGTYVQDALAANLLTGATINAAGTTNGTAVQVDRPGDVAVLLATGTVTGTTPTISVLVQGSDDVTFASGVVNYGVVGISTGAAAAQSSQERVLNARIYKKYVRCTVTTGGTSPVYTGSKVTLEQPNIRRTSSTSA